MYVDNPRDYQPVLNPRLEPTSGLILHRFDGDAGGSILARAVCSNHFVFLARDVEKKRLLVLEESGNVLIYDGDLYIH